MARVCLICLRMSFKWAHWDTGENGPVRSHQLVCSLSFGAAIRAFSTQARDRVMNAKKKLCTCQ